MELQTKVDIPSPVRQISHSDKIMFLGSCFADEIGGRMEEHMYDVMVNPFGVLFNPASIAASLHRLSCREYFTEESLVKHKDLWLSYFHSGRFYSADKYELLERLNVELDRAADHFASARHVILTLGTSRVYRLISGNYIVANCHRSPASDFERLLLEPDEIWGLLGPLITAYPDKQWILTVSPVRHLKDGARENQVSKASLHLAVDKLLKCYGNVSYFPAYEIMNDELRDYRFYATDMFHPAETAVGYIWEKFARSHFPEGEQRLNEKIARYCAMSKHRALFPESEEFTAFRKSAGNLKEEIDKDLSFFR